MQGDVRQIFNTLDFIKLKLGAKYYSGMTWGAMSAIAAEKILNSVTIEDALPMANRTNCVENFWKRILTRFTLLLLP